MQKVLGKGALSGTYFDDERDRFRTRRIGDAFENGRTG